MKDKKVVFVSHLILNPNECKNKEKMQILMRDLINVFAEAGVGIIQMPFLDYDSFKNPVKLKNFSSSIAEQIKEYLKDCHVLAILNTNKSRKVINEIESEMQKRRVQIPIIGIDAENLIDSMRKIQLLIKYCDF